MSNIKQDLDRIKERISDSNFLANKGLSNEVGIHVFCYNPADELIVREYIARLKSDTSLPFRIIEQDMYNIFLEILEESRVLEHASSMEKKYGKSYLLENLQKIASPDDFIEKMMYEPHDYGDVIFLTGLGKVYPFMRSHKMLDNMQKVFYKIPIVMFYPGVFNSKDLVLFGKFFDGHYYRAFNLL